VNNDTPSSTARKVALNIVSLGAKPGMEEVLPAGIVDATAQVLRASGVVGERALQFAASQWAVAIYEAFDWMIPGQFEAFAHRKAFCERQVREGIAAGAAQVLVLGAGFDTLGWRLAPEFPAVHFVEIDHPASARVKAKAISEMGTRDNLRLIPVDLGERRLTDVLAEVQDWDSGFGTVVIAEGLTQYLMPAAVRDLFAQCHAVSGPGSRFAFTHVGTDDEGRPDIGRWTGLVLWILKRTGEPWLWTIRPDDLPEFLADTGWAHTAKPADSPIRCGAEYHAVASK
jgi:methyltransferase (TIGR00027 family)